MPGAREAGQGGTRGSSAVSHCPLVTWHVGVRVPRTHDAPGPAQSCSRVADRRGSGSAPPEVADPPDRRAGNRRCEPMRSTSIPWLPVGSSGGCASRVVAGPAGTIGASEADSGNGPGAAVGHGRWRIATSRPNALLQRGARWVSIGLSVGHGRAATAGGLVERRRSRQRRAGAADAGRCLQPVPTGDEPGANRSGSVDRLSRLLVEALPQHERRPLAHRDEVRVVRRVPRAGIACCP
jgi:hypothetical protein